MRHVIEPHVGFIVPAVDALPGNVFASIEIGRDLLNCRLIRSLGLMTAHAPSHIGNGGPRAGERTGMAVQAFHHRSFNMGAMIVGNGLHGFGSHSKEMTDRQADCRMS